MRHLLVISLGPVQEFIATARRTRDLYAGSRLLSEAAASAAAFLAGRVGYPNLIFPAPDSAKSLEELREAGIPNIVLAVVPEGEDPKALGEGALKAARDYLEEKAKEVFQKYRGHLDEGTAISQVKDVLEGYYAHVPLGEDYRQARERAMALLAARKNTRDFKPVGWGSAAFKSSLDGARESVLHLPDHPQAANRLRLGLRPGEYLSGPDLLKRWWPVEKGFVSTTHMAAMPFWEGVKAKGKEAEDLVWEALQDLAGLVEGEAEVQVRHPVLQGTPFEKYDVRLLYETRLEEFPSLAEAPSRLKAAQERLRRLWEALRDQGLRPPGAYYALLHADGDRMGETLDRLTTPERHRDFSNTLAKEFALKVKDIVQKHGGGLVYSGGDDVLALLPLHRALACAWELSRHFQEVMGRYGQEGSRPTLSVGLAVVHHLEPLQDALDLVRKAERYAKEGEKDEDKRNALAVVYSPRSGAEVWARGRFDESPRLTQRLLRYADLLRLEEVPSRAAYELRELVREVGGSLQDEALVAEALVAEALRILGRKEMQRPYLEELSRWIQTGRDVRRLAQELILARPFAETLELAGIPKESREVWDAH